MPSLPASPPTALTGGDCTVTCSQPLLQWQVCPAGQWGEVCGLEEAAQGGQLPAVGQLPAQGGQLPAVGQPGAPAGGQLGTQGVEQMANMFKVYRQKKGFQLEIPGRV